MQGKDQLLMLPSIIYLKKARVGKWALSHLKRQRRCFYYNGSERQALQYIINLEMVHQWFP